MKSPDTFKVLPQYLLCGRSIDTGIVWFHKGLLDLAILDQEGIPLAPPVPKDGHSIES